MKRWIPTSQPIKKQSTDINTTDLTLVRKQTSGSSNMLCNYSLKGILSATRHIFDSNVLPILQQQFGGASFLLQHVPLCTKRSVQKRFPILGPWPEPHLASLGTNGNLSASQALPSNTRADLAKALVAEWETAPAAKFFKSSVSKEDCWLL